MTFNPNQLKVWDNLIYDGTIVCWDIDRCVTSVLLIQKIYIKYGKEQAIILHHNKINLGIFQHLFLDSNIKPWQFTTNDDWQST